MIVITGASDGLGKELARLFKADGKTVINLSRSDNPETVNVAADLTDEVQIKQAASKVLEQKEPLEALINCAGVMSVEPLNGIAAAEIERVFRVNVMGPMLLTSLLAARIKQDEGDIVNIASTVGTKAYKGQAAYGSSKWAMRGFSQNLQLEFKDSKVRVISACVGGFKSRIAEKIGQPPLPDPENWMNADDVARCVKQLLELPKNMEVSEVVLNRKTTT